MKDTVHHLKHVQKKIIRSARQAQLSEENYRLENQSKSTATSLLESPERSKKRFK